MNRYAQALRNIAKYHTDPYGGECLNSATHASRKPHDSESLSLRNVCRGCALSSPPLTHRANSLRRSNTDNRARGWRRCLYNATSRSNANGDIRITATLLPLNNHVSVSQTSHRQASSNPSLVMVVEGDGTSATIRPPNREVLAKITVVFGPELVLCAVAGVVAVEGVAGVVGGIVLGECVHDVEFYAGVACEAVEGEVGVSLGVVVGGVIDHTDACMFSEVKKEGRKNKGRTGFDFRDSLCRRQSFHRRLESNRL
jgi:hypothetical protein